MAELLLSTFCSDKLKFDFFSEDPSNHQKFLQREYEDILIDIRSSDSPNDPYVKTMTDELFLLKIGNTSELPLTSMSNLEKEKFPNIVENPDSVSHYLSIRNKILAEWYKYSSMYMSLSSVLHYYFPQKKEEEEDGSTKDICIKMDGNEDYISLIKETYFFLFRNCFINYGVLSIMDREIYIPKEKKKVVIIGSGLAGLTCAKQLSRLGLNVVVLEARDKIGGRIETIESNGVKVDIGAFLLTTEWKDHLNILLDQCSIDTQVIPDKVILLDHKKDLFKEVAFSVACKIFMEDLDLLIYSEDSSISEMTLYEAFELMKERKDSMANVLRENILNEFDDLFNKLGQACIDGYCNLHSILSDYDRRKNAFFRFIRDQRNSKNNSTKSREAEARNTVISDLLAHVSLKKFNLICEDLKDTRELIELMNELLDSASYYQNGAPHFIYDQLQTLFFSSIEQAFGCCVKELKISSMKQFSWSNKRQKFFSLNNGLSDMIEKLSDNINISVNKPVKCITYSETKEKFILSGSDFKEICDIVVSTLPIGVLKTETVKFEPELPSSKKQAINKCKLAVKRELIFQFDEIFWDKKVSVFSKVANPFNSSEEMVIVYAVPLKPILVVLWGGQNASKTFTWSEEKLIERSAYMLKSIFEKSYVPYTSVINKNWNDEEYIQCYHVIPIGDEGIVKELAKPIHFKNLDHLNGIYFAGEHTNLCEQGTLSAAFCSGLRVASEIANDFINDLT
uniref:Lysine-specific histone demethylase 1A (inferred by orthology to a human protein) n=1 Tax=Strongyloides venezuelensis TaxID=75913 RepID=A0A0K0F5G3_STRVS